MGLGQRRNGGQVEEIVGDERDTVEPRTNQYRVMVTRRDNPPRPALFYRIFPAMNRDRRAFSVPRHFLDAAALFDDVRCYG